MDVRLVQDHTKICFAPTSKPIRAYDWLSLFEAVLSIHHMNFGLIIWLNGLLVVQNSKSEEKTGRTRRRNYSFNSTRRGEEAILRRLPHTYNQWVSLGPHHRRYYLPPL